MREGIHPEYYQAKVVCNCGNEFVTGSTKEDIHVEVCSKCHPFYTGQQKSEQSCEGGSAFFRKWSFLRERRLYEIFGHWRTGCDRGRYDA